MRVPSLVLIWGSRSTCQPSLWNFRQRYFTIPSCRLIRAPCVRWHCCSTWLSVSASRHPALHVMSRSLPRDVRASVGIALIRSFVQSTKSLPLRRRVPAATQFWDSGTEAHSRRGPPSTDLWSRSVQ
uniref:Uncharacterized protein n=1 Tax=Ixodes ricinus TaxID=34613 RepID=A0A147BJ76_IXORI